MSSAQAPDAALDEVLTMDRREAPAELAAEEQPAPARSALARAVPILRVLGFVAAFAIVLYVATRAVGDVDLSELAWWPLAPAFAATLVWWLLLARGWAVLSTGEARRGDISTWCRTQSLRYLPGGIWAPASRVAIIRGSWFDRLATVAAENVISLCAALAVGGLFLGLSGEFPWLALVLCFGIPVLAARFFADRTRIDPARALTVSGNYAIGFVAYSVAAVLVQIAVSGVHDPLAVAGAATLAWSLGLVVVIAPGGVGVREAAYVALLSSTLPTGELAAAAVAMRVIAVIAELTILLAAGRPAPRAEAPRAAGGP